MAQLSTLSTGAQTNLDRRQNRKATVSSSIRAPILATVDTGSPWAAQRRAGPSVPSRRLVATRLRRRRRLCRRMKTARLAGFISSQVRVFFGYVY